MKLHLVAAFAAVFSITSAFAGEAEGVITEVNSNNYTLKLSGDTVYVLPEQVDISLIGPGMRVALAFDEVDGKNVITDMSQVN